MFVGVFLPDLYCILVSHCFRRVWTLSHHNRAVELSMWFRTRRSRTPVCVDARYVVIQPPNRTPTAEQVLQQPRG